MYYKQMGVCVGGGCLSSPQVKIRDTKYSYISEYMIGPIPYLQIHVLFLIIILVHLLFWIISTLTLH